MTQTKRVLVTGGGKGIGRSIVEELAGNGYAVDFTYNSSESAAEDLVHALVGDNSSVEVRAVRCDLARRGDVEMICEQFETEDCDYYGLVHNAGTTYDALTAHVELAKVERLLEVNFLSFIRISNALVRGMMRQRAGRVVIIGSISAAMGSRGNAIYSASKSALAAYARTLVAEYARKGICINTVAPGYIDTDMMQKYERYRADMAKRIPNRRFGVPDDISSLVAFLLSDRSSYINGATIHIDGGVTACLNM